MPFPFSFLWGLARRADPPASSSQPGGPDDPGSTSAPAPGLLASDVPRAAAELAYSTAAWPWLPQAAQGDSHPVLVIPGLLLDDTYTAPLRWFLHTCGHNAIGWGGGLNFGHFRLVDELLKPELDRLCEAHGRTVSVVGASVGGLFARSLALRWPEQVRCVVTLASSVGGSPRANHVWPFYQAMTGQPAETLVVPPPVPSTSVYSRVDGVNNWRTCLQPEGLQRENVEVLASHHGLALHPATFYLVADRLAQPEGSWAPFQRPPSGAAYYPKE